MLRLEQPIILLFRTGGKEGGIAITRQHRRHGLGSFYYLSMHSTKYYLYAINKVFFSAKIFYFDEIPSHPLKI